MKSVKYLEMVRDMLPKRTDRALAEKLHLSQGAVSHYLTGRRVMDDETCLAIAMELGINPMDVVGAACIDRAEKTGQKSLWEVFMSRTAQRAAASTALAVFVTLFLTTPTPAEAKIATVDNNINYAKLWKFSISVRKCSITQIRDSLICETSIPTAWRTSTNTAALHMKSRFLLA